ALEAKLTGREKRDIESPGTKNPEAYDSYLHALALLTHQGIEPIEKRINFLHRAVKLDPNYAEAWSLLGTSEAERYVNVEHTEAELTRARTAAETAMRLAPDLPDAHVAVGLFYYYCLQDFDRALTELEFARARAPNDAGFLLGISVVKRRQGKLDEAIELQRKASELDPLNQDVWVNLGR